jgi:uncharacterized protein YcnI
MSTPQPSLRRGVRRLAATGALFAALGVTFAGAASAHVVITPGEAAPGGFATVAFQVPNESDSASTVKLEVQFPADHPIPFVSVEPVPGWTIDVQKATLDTPIESHGNEITEAVSTITWTGGAIEPGQFQRFPVSVGPLPEDVDSLEFKAVQTYSDGEVSRWIEPANPDGSEPEKPAPVLTLAGETAGHGDDAAADDGAASDEPADAGHDEDAAAAESTTDDSDSSSALAIVGIVLGALGLVVAIVALTRKPSTSTG